MEAEKLLSNINALETTMCHKRYNDAKTKYQLITLFRGIKDCVQYRIPTPPINVSEDERYFQCPRCEMMYETELDYKAKDFNCCPNCGQLFIRR